MATVATLSDSTIVGENEEQLVTMIVDNQLFGVPILQVQDIVEASKITPVPLAPSAIAGVLNLRGRIVTVIDLRKILGNNEEVPWESQMGVTIEHKGDLYTLLVDAIGDVRTLPKRDFDVAPSTMEERVRQLCSGIFRLRGNLLVVLDVSRILQPAVIEATPQLSVEERRSRKIAAIESNVDTRAEGGRQLSALMTDLNAYESDFDSGLDSLANEDDDIKARKKANRDRRPVSERWREVLDEKARREGHSSVYRMREPDEEVIEDAREEEKKQQAEWENEWQARQEGSYVPRLEADAGDEQAMTGSDEPASLDEMAAFDEPSSDMPMDAPAAFDEPAADMPMDAPAAFDEPAADMPMDAPAAFDEPAAEMPMDEPVAFDEPVAEAPVEEASLEEAISFDELVAETPVEDAPAGDMVSFDEPVAETPVEDVPADDMVSLDDPAAEAPVEEAVSFDEPVAEAPSDEIADSEVSDAGEETTERSSGVVSDWWNKMRGKSESKEEGEKSEPQIDIPNAEDIPAETSDAGEDADGDDTDKKSKKPASKSKAKSASKSKKKK